MQCGIPVITSNTSSLPEVCGDAAIYVNPLEVESIAQGMLRLYQNPELRISLTEAANMQLKKFSWEHTAAAFWHSILTTINT
jgi:glycosyltransferase involved in cell wall biosynthesis